MENMITNAWTSFSVTDLKQASFFYKDILGLAVKDHPMGMLEIQLPGAGTVWIYPKDSHKPATYTVLNLVVKDIEKGVEQLIASGIIFEHYPSFNTDEKGIARHEGRPAIAWFKDPSGNILALMEEL